MSGNNMESLLLGDDDGDSSSGDSDDEVNIQIGPPAASAVAAPVQQLPASAVAAPPPPAPAPAPRPSASSRSNSQSETMAKLKSLYSSQPRKQQQQPPQPSSTGPSTPQTSNTSRQTLGSGAPPAPSLHSSSAQQYQQVQAQAVRPLMPNRPPGHQQPQQQPQMPQQQSQAMPQQPQRSHSQPYQTSQQHAAAPTSDPFAPTPLHQIKERQYQKQQQQQQQYHPGSNSSRVTPQPPAHTAPTSSSSRPVAASQSLNPQDRAAMERELRRQKERFLMFTRVLMKYLEQKDPSMHQKAKIIIKDCADRNKRQEPGYESVTSSMRERLKNLVGEQYWKRAESYLKHFLEQKSRPGASGSSGPSTNASATTQSRVPTASAPAPSNISRQQQLTEQENQRKLQAAQATSSSSQSKPAVQQSRPTPATVPAIANLRQEISAKKQALSSAASTTSSNATPTAANTASSAGGKGITPKSGKKAPSAKRKSATTTSPPAASRKTSTTPTATSTAAAAPAPATTVTAAAAAPVPPPKQEEVPPREYNELMEMVDHAVDYDWTTSGMLLGSKTHLQLTEEQRNLLYSEAPESHPLSAEPPLKGWGKRNVVTARVAWARVRLRKQTQKPKAPVVADGLLSLPAGKSSTSSDAPPLFAWVNEETAEEDAALCMLSEGCQLYLKSMLEKAIHCARQRQNLDGIRLWHEQHSSGDNETKPPLSLRLGCDVTRQVAQAVGNAAMTCKRMEQALERQSGVPARARILRDETLREASSMSDLGMRPKLAKGVEHADYHAKRSFEIFGGKGASDPPFGRVPKQAKLEPIDFVMGSSFTEHSRHRAGTASTSIYF